MGFKRYTQSGTLQVKFHFRYWYYCLRLIISTKRRDLKNQTP